MSFKLSKLQIMKFIKLKKTVLGIENYDEYFQGFISAYGQHFSLQIHQNLIDHLVFILMIPHLLLPLS